MGYNERGDNEGSETVHLITDSSDYNETMREGKR